MKIFFEIIFMDKHNNLMILFIYKFITNGALKENEMFFCFFVYFVFFFHFQMISQNRK